jgi:hypothetical protein
VRVACQMFFSLQNIYISSPPLFPPVRHCPECGVPPMEVAAAAGETMTMRDRIRIYVLVVALALSIAVAPAQASPVGDHASVGWWDAVVDALAELFGLAGTDNPPPSTPDRDGSLCIDPLGGCRS